MLNINFNDLVDILKKTAVDWKKHANELRELDALMGDGDLGVTVELGADAMVAYLSAPDETDAGKMLAKLGMNVNKINPSTFGTLLASAFLGAGKQIIGKPDIGATELLAMGYGAIEGIKKRGKAEAGDKTMLDALIPAVDQLANAISQNLTIIEALQLAVNKAENGMHATTNMKAKFGRVSWRPDGGIGTRDAGATAMYYFIAEFSKNLIAILDKKH